MQMSCGKALDIFTWLNDSRQKTSVVLAGSKQNNWAHVENVLSLFPFFVGSRRCTRKTLKCQLFGSLYMVSYPLFGLRALKKLLLGP